MKIFDIDFVIWFSASGKRDTLNYNKEHEEQKQTVAQYKLNKDGRDQLTCQIIFRTDLKQFSKRQEPLFF